MIFLLNFALVSNCSYSQKLRTGSVKCIDEMSLNEFRILLEKKIIPDIPSITNESFLLCESIEMKVDHSTAQPFFDISFRKKGEKYPLNYRVYKKLWVIDGHSFTVFSIHGWKWRNAVSIWCFALAKDDEIYNLAGFKRCDYQKLFAQLNRSNTTENLFYDSCIFYLENVYAFGEEVKIIENLKDIQYDDSTLSFKKLVEESLKEKLHSPLLKSFPTGYSLSLFTYYDKEFVEWNFNIDKDNVFTTTRNLIYKIFY